MSDLLNEFKQNSGDFSCLIINNCKVMVETCMFKLERGCKLVDQKYLSSIK